MKPQRGDLVKVDWKDIQSDSRWAGTEWDLEPMPCVSYGIFHSNGKVVRLHASYNEEDIGDRIVIPKEVVTKITVIKRAVYGHKKPGETKRRG